jgi:hypothetical protein
MNNPSPFVGLVNSGTEQAVDIDLRESYSPSFSVLGQRCYGIYAREVPTGYADVSRLHVGPKHRLRFLNR